MNEEWTKATIERHRGQSNISPELLFHFLCAELDRSVSTKTRIYLDSCYWIRLRECSQGHPRTADDAELFDRLRGLVKSGAVICPVSDAAIVETMKASDKSTRLATADVFDEFSGGVCLRTESERMKLELFEMISSGLKPRRHVGMSLWVRPGMAMGAMVPSAPSKDADFNTLAGKIAIEWMWQRTFHDLAETDDISFGSAMAESAIRLNQKNEEYADGLKSRKHAFRSELSGMVKFFDEDVIRMVMRDRKLSGTDKEIETFKENMRGCLYHVCDLNPKFMAPKIPTMYIAAVCHGARRWDKRWRFSGNDLMDIHHAIAGLGYGQIMLTEKPLAAFIKSLGLDEMLDVRVLCEYAEIHSCLRELG